jgi:2-oxoglutarate dehydrogenase E2 component (dihydrolipoamide succinyltransferase)
MPDHVEVRAPAEQTEGTRSQILRWLKRPGETVTENEPLIEIETDKVTVEVASPAAGVLREILKHEQEEIAPGELLGRIEAGGGVAAGLAAATAAPPARAATAAAPLATAARPPASATVSPAVRRLLSEHGLEASAVVGSGPSGRIMVEDVLRAAAGTRAAAAPAAEPNEVTAAAGAGTRRVPHSAVRKRIAEHMVQSLLHTAPHVTSVFEADVSAVLEDRARRREAFAREGVPLTLTAYFVQAAVAALRAVPEANSRWTETALEIYEAMNIGIATAVQGTGLLVPVLHEAQARDLLDTARGLDDLVQRARAGRLTPADVRGGTFTISNHGVSGSLLAAPIIINQPQSAILGIGKLERRAVVVQEGDQERIVVQPRCYVTLTVDHRVMDGHEANRFLTAFVAKLTAWAA